MNSARCWWLILLWVPASSALADTVSGQFVLNGKPLKPSEVAAFRIRDQFHAREFETYVMLTQKPVNRDAIAKSIDPYTAAINDKAVLDADYIALSVHGDGVIGMNAKVGGVQYVDSSGTIMMQQGSLKATCTSNSKERVSCTVKTAEPVKTTDGTIWSVDFTFDSAVLGHTPGKPLAKDGGEPGKAFRTFLTAAQGDDLAKITAQMSRRQAAGYQRDYNTPAENLKDLKQTMGFKLPKQPRVSGGELVDDDYALLDVEGDSGGGSAWLFRVEMRREDGHWVYDDAGRVGMLK
ncbi:MAG: hypothetical protein E6K53_13785 [Gammaproteobacteria bacterium]|nr:MAG: hypothetical protein E6K53_13785 [Gammaproteobacteria bacterium]